MTLQGNAILHILSGINSGPLFARVVVLDHHKTAKEALSDPTKLPSNLDVCIDMSRSGATMSLEYFQPEVPANFIHLSSLLSQLEANFFFNRCLTK